jgi:hypothetical protein
VKVSALADPDCDRCKRAANGVCFEHAGAKASPDADDPRRCVGVNANGSRCKRWVLRDNDMCATHDKRRRGDMATMATSAARGVSKSRLMQAAQDHMRAVGKPHRKIDPLEELERLSVEALELKDWFHLRFVEMLDQLQKDGIEKDTHELEARLNLYTAALERASTLVTGYGKHSLDKREIEQKRELSAVVSALFLRLLAEFVPSDRQDAAKVMLAQTVAAIEAPR